MDLVDMVDSERDPGEATQFFRNGEKAMDFVCPMWPGAEIFYT
jgi:hypothetical protein